MHQRVGWMDLTVDDAEGVRAFYEQVLQATSQPVSMGEYNDYVLLDGGQALGGVCHRRGPNGGLPPAWLVYFTVDDLEAALARVLAGGGRLVDGPRSAGGRLVVVADPAGAVFALYQPA